MLLFKDGYDYLTAANITLKWDTSTSGGATLLTGVYGKGSAIKNFAGTKALPSNYAEGFQGFHYFYASAQAGQFCSFLDGAPVQVDFRTHATGAVFATRNGTTIGTVSATRLVPGTTYWIVCRVKVDATSGIAEMAVNGTVVLNSGVTNLNTKTSANAYFNKISLITQSSTHWFDSYHCWDTTGGDSFSTYIAETIIDTKLPASAGSNTSWTPNASTNVSRVNEANEDGDTTYNSSSTANQIDSFNLGTLDETAGTILDVAINTIDRIDDATPRVIKHYALSSSTSALGAAISPTSSYKNHQSFFAVDPDTSAAWTISGRNAAEAGYKLIS